MKDFAIKIIYTCIDELNEDLEEGEKIEKASSSVLFGSGSMLDSMSLVNLITAIEELIEDDKGVYLTLADENAMSMTNSPFKTVETLADYIVQLLAKEEKS
jgi:D-alanine--poly(phosphoribitol) ligase subunit 2